MVSIVLAAKEDLELRLSRFNCRSGIGSDVYIALEGQDLARKTEGR